jgi:hypothetical protein
MESLYLFLGILNNRDCPIYAGGVPQIKPAFREIAPSGISSNISPHFKGGMIRGKSPMRQLRF